MITTISVHYVNAGLREEALDLLEATTILGRKQTGFISRDIFIAVDDPMKMTTVTSWETKEQLDTWGQNTDRPKRDKDAPPLFSKVDIQVYEEHKIS